MLTSEMLTEKLESLGSTAEEVAQTLRLLGITKARQGASECPIAKFVNLFLVPPHFASVLPGNVWILGGPELVRVTNPKPVEDFIIEFDRTGVI